MRYFLTFVLCTVLCLATTSFAADKKEDKKEFKNTKERTYQLLNLFGEVFERTRETYVEEVDDKQLIEAAINGMLTDLDPHSSFLNAEDFNDMDEQTRGEFGGLGIEVTMEKGVVKVVSPMDDTPADKAGIEAGDLITHLDEEPIQGMSLTEAVKKMKGRPGTKVKLTVYREGEEPFDVTVKRAVIKLEPVKSEVKDDKVGYLRISQFNEKTLQQLKEHIEKIQKQVGKDLLGFVVDVRNNPGGLLEQAIGVSDVFLAQGEIVSTRSRDPKDTIRFDAEKMIKGDLTNGLPLVVIVNSGSASASEIVAGALQDHHRAILIGTKSFGKGSVQTIMPVQQKTAMRITTARYYTPSGRSIQGEGIEPDIEVKQAHVEELDSSRRFTEADLRGALENDNEDNGYLKSKKKKSEKSSDKKSSFEKDDDEKEDYQLERAVDLLKGLALYTSPTHTKSQEPVKDKTKKGKGKKAD